MRKFYMVSLLLLIAFSSCNKGKHFISDNDYRLKVEKQFEIQKELARARHTQLFDVFNQDLSLEEEEALKFLYAYMPLSDLAEYDGAFFLNNVRCALAARDTFSWGNKVPEVLYRHFVLPVRVNNEHLDTSRIVFFNELKDRVKGLSMEEAVLEINHWCHEKVVYQSTDARTSSPLTTLRTAFGRCGEESTFTVAALRSVGIPARQCYTPRWAHCDDNHAWVEVWVDSTWHFIGACEPEAFLDKAWFTGPARRAMLVNTNVFGDYDGPEEVLFKNEYFTRINLIENYAPVKSIRVKALNADGSKADSARVSFCLYNYAEFYPIARKYTDKEGWSGLTTGLGDLLIWVDDGVHYGFEKLSVAHSDSLIIRMDKDGALPASLEYDLIPPVERTEVSEDRPETQEINQCRLKAEDSIRTIFVKGFPDSLACVKLANECRLDSDSLRNRLLKSRGNYREIQAFARKGSQVKKNFVLPLLFALTEKDLHDMNAEVLMSHLELAPLPNDKYNSDEEGFFVNYVMNPRIYLEQITDYRNAILSLKEQMIGEEKNASLAVNHIKDWIKNNITINEEANYYHVPISPRGSIELRVCDAHSRDILFVAICRTFGIPARMDWASRSPEYWDSEWKPAAFNVEPETVSKTAVLIIFNDQQGALQSPQYYIHYTIAVLKDGFYKTLDYEDSPLVAKFPVRLELEPGQYMMVCGNRLPGGQVLSSIQFFTLSADSTREVSLAIRTDARALPILGKPVEKISAIDPVSLKNIDLLYNKKNTVVIWLDPLQEPSRHVLAEIAQLKADYEKKSVAPVFVLTENSLDLFLKDHKSKLPSSSAIFLDSGSAMKVMRKSFPGKFNDILPLIAVFNSESEVVLLTSGYSIGRGEEILKTMELLKKDK